MQDNMTGELAYLQSKLRDRKQKVNASLVANYVTSQEITRVR